MDIEKETQAIQEIARALEPLEEESRTRVLSYVFEALGLREIGPAPIAAPASVPDAEQVIDARAEAVRDIRSLKVQKDPRSAIEMAALVAYYLAELAPEEERSETVDAADLEKYFKQADYPLPARTRQTLINAAAGGYLDLVSRGQYKLNPVGYNLVAHTLPAQGARGDNPEKLRPTRRKTAAKRKPARKKAGARKPSAKKASSR